MKSYFLFLLITTNFLITARLFNIHNNSGYYTVTISPNQNIQDPAAVTITKNSIIAKKDIPCSQSLIITTNNSPIAPNSNSPARNQNGYNASQPQTLTVDCMDYRILDIWINEAKNGVFAVTTLENRPARTARKAPKKKLPKESPEKEQAKVE